MTDDPIADSAAAVFPTTCWSQVRPGSEAGLQTLARLYWRPVRAYLRTALARTSEDAADLAQDFFVWMIETRFLEKADPSRGRFRAFVKTALRNYVADGDRRARAAKRGGSARIVPIDAGAAPDPPSTALAPDEALDAAWRAECVERARAAVEEELRREGREVVYAVFRDYFLDASDEADYRALAERHGISTVDVSNHLARAKKLYRAKLRAVVLDTVRSPEDLEEELRWLFGKETR
jgi:RNA polymerase sigma factor (sigma-70 family)